MSPEDEAMLRARLNEPAGPSGPTGPRGPGLAERYAGMQAGAIAGFRDALGYRSNGESRADNMIDSANRLAANPAMQGLQALGSPVPFLNTAGNYAVDKLNIGKRDTTSFTREEEGGPQHVELRPTAQGIEPTIAPSVTLDPRYGQAPAARSGGMGGGGGSTGNLAREYRDAQGNMIRSFNTEQDLVERRGELHVDRAESEAKERELMAARATRDAEVKAQHDAEVDRRHADFLARNQQLADDINSQKISPQAVIDEMGAGTKIGLILAGALTGAAGQGPAMMARVDGIIDQGVRAQMANVDGKKAKLAARQGIFQQMMAESGDRKVAEAQTRALAWEAVKHQAEADARRRGIPEEINQADMLRNEIDEKKINPLRVQLTGDALRAQQAQALAAANAQRQDEERRYQRFKDDREYGLKSDAQKIDLMKLDRESQSKDDTNERFVATGQDDNGTPTGYLARNAADASKQEKKRIANEKLLGLIDEAQKTRNEQGYLGRAATAANPATLKWESKMNVLRGKMTGAIKDAEELGTLDAGSQAFADALTGGNALTGVGGKADDTLAAFRATLEAGKKADTTGAAGTQAMRIVDPRTGRERVILTGGQNAPRSDMPDSVKRK